MATSKGFEQLSYGVQRWVYKQGWKNLRAVQEEAIPLVLDGDADILITAPTAGGKTEAAFLPLVSWLESGGAPDGYGVLCISPLKALINDQFDRLELLCESAHTEITPWHGDINQSVKKKSWLKPSGILMITPESLESMAVIRPVELLQRIQSLQYVVIDEFHAFIGAERGQQLISLLARLEVMLGRSLRRLALSATIGDPDVALAYLRPDASRKGFHLDVKGEKFELMLQIKAYQTEHEDIPASLKVAQDLFEWLRGGRHLVFANSRRAVEESTDRLVSLCEAHHVPLEFFAHHGSLSKDARHYVENRLRTSDKPTTAIATSTLELGIDIGDVESVGQLGPPSNVSSVRQRLGRSGRREGQSAILRVQLTSDSNKPGQDPASLLELQIFQSVAVIDKLLQRWIEPPDISLPHYSTLVQQLLSMIAYRGEVTAVDAYQTLCRHGPWTHLDQNQFKRFLRSIASKDVIDQLPSGELIVGIAGELELSRYDFYTTFKVPEEFRLMAYGNAIGSIPVDNPVVPGQLILLSGRRWKVVSVELEQKVITLVKGGAGMAPRFGGEPASAHRQIHQHMKMWYESNDVPAYCDELARELIRAARDYYRENNLGLTPFVREGNCLYWLIWEDKRIINTLVVVATAMKFPAGKVFGPSIEVTYSGEPLQLAHEIYYFLVSHSHDELLASVPTTPIGKFDHLLDDDLLFESYVASTLNIAGTLAYLERLVNPTIRGH